MTRDGAGLTEIKLDAERPATRHEESDMRTASFVVALAFIVSHAHAGGPDLSGKVLGDDGKPVPGARVMMYTAAVRTGTSPMCPSCWVDCAKSATTSAGGAFIIKSLDPQLLFRVLVVAEGFKPTFLEKVDPAAGAVEAKLAKVPADLAPAKVLRGKVSDFLGRPVVGATVHPWGARRDGRRWWGRVDGVDAVAITNAKGEFALVCDAAGDELDLEVDARGLAVARFALLPAGPTVHALKLGEGATVTGRLVTKDGQPLAGVEVGMVSADRGVEQFAGPYRVGTDAAGRFTFSNVVPDRDYFVYGAMTALAGRGAASVKTVAVGDHGSTASAGDLSVGPAYRLSGRIVLSDGKLLPPGTRVMLSRDSAWDSQNVEAAGDGTFSFEGVPPERVSVGVRVKGYHVSDANESLDRLNRLSLEGMVDGDVTDLRVQLDPGPGQPPGFHNLDPAERNAFAERHKRTRNSRIAGAPAPAAE